jgi:hypothetical protein
MDRCVRGLSVSRRTNPEIKRKGIGQQPKTVVEKNKFKNIIVKE